MGIRDNARQAAPLIAHLLLIWETLCNNNSKRAIRVACTAPGSLCQRAHQLACVFHLGSNGDFFLTKTIVLKADQSPHIRQQRVLFVFFYLCRER